MAADERPYFWEDHDRWVSEVWRPFLETYRRAHEELERDQSALRIDLAKAVSSLNRLETLVQKATLAADTLENWSAKTWLRVLGLGSLLVGFVGCASAVAMLVWTVTHGPIK